MISEILPSSSGCKFNPFKNCCNPFASDGFWVSLITFFGSLLHQRGWETGGNGRNDFCRPYQNTLCLFFDLGHCVSLGTLEEGCVRSSHITAAVVVISIHHLTRQSIEECGEQRVSCDPCYYGYPGLYKCLGKSEAVCQVRNRKQHLEVRSDMCCVHFSTGPRVQTHKSLIIWEVSVSLKMSQWLHGVRLNILKAVF